MFTTGQVLTAAQMTSLQQTAMLGGAATAKTASYVLVAADAGDAITMSNASATTITVNTGLFAAGDIVTIINLGAGVSTITAGTATVSTSGSLALAQNQGGVLRFTSASAAIFFQFATPASGDIEGVTAGTGISGGGTSGTVTITNDMATTITASGDIVVGTGSGTYDNLPIGTTGQILTADTTVSPYKVKWATAAGGGKVLQVVSATYSTETSTTSASFQDTNLTASITPSSASSKVLVLVSQPFYATRNSDECGGHSQLLRGATQLAEHGPRLAYVRQTGGSLTEAGTVDNYVYLDSPNTTSSTTYKTQMRVKNAADSSTIRSSNDNNLSSIILLEIGA